MTAIIMIGATVAYFAITIPLAMWFIKWIGRRK